MNAIKLARIKKGLKQIELARLIELPENRVSKIETDRIIPDKETLKKIATVLGVSLKELKTKGDKSC